MELSIAILLRLLLAHIISDFILQSKRMSEGKRGNIENQEKYKCLYLLGHSLIHATVSYIFVAEWGNWSIPLIIFISHLIIDYIKSNYTESVSSLIVDQAAHIAVIVGIWLLLFDQCSPTFDLLDRIFISNQLLVAIIAYLFVLKPTSIMLACFLKQWDLAPTDGDRDKRLKDAGKWIGYMERILIVTFVITNNLTAIGFLLAAKSIFRFGELKDGTEIKRTEYVLIGTLASFSIAIIAGLVMMSLQYGK